MRRFLIVAAALAMVLASCADGGVGTGTRPSSPVTAVTAAPASGAIAWTACGEHLDCGTLAVPLEPDDPGGATITLALARMPARNPDLRIGALLVNPGGPGASGVDFVSFGELFDAEVQERFDVIGFDPRGVGASRGLRCGGGLVERFAQLDPDPDDPVEQATLEQAAIAIADDCAAREGDLLPHIGTRDVARDIDTIRRALGEETITYVGFSYGTLLGQRFAEEFGGSARAIVLDALVDPSNDFRALLWARTETLDRTIADVFEECESTTSDCPSIGAAAAYDRIAAAVESHALPAGDDQLGPGDLPAAAMYVTYSPILRRSFYEALADGLSGDGLALYDLADSYRSFGGFTSYLAVTCVDSPHPVGAEEYAAFAADLEELSPRFGAAVANELLPCAFWPTPPASEPAVVTAPGGPPILVIGNTGDAVTPYEGAQRVAGRLNGVLLTYEGAGHTSFVSSPCVTTAVTRYLIHLQLPAVGTVCR